MSYLFVIMKKQIGRDFLSNLKALILEAFKDEPLHETSSINQRRTH